MYIYENKIPEKYISVYLYPFIESGIKFTYFYYSDPSVAMI